MAVPKPQRERSTRPYRDVFPQIDDLMETVGELQDSTDRASVLDTLSKTDGPGRFVRGKEVGRGGMSNVYQAEDRDLGRIVAWKQLRSEGQTMRVKRFVNEAQLMGQLEHPGILPVHELGILRGEFYYVMRYVRGDTTLRHVIDRLKAGEPEAHAFYSMERRVRIVQQVAETLHYAHRKGVVHRDVKPENIMVGEQGQVYLVDWGLAKVDMSEDESGEVPLKVEEVRTAPGAILGTPLYMSPEQLYGSVDPRADVYSLSVVLYELLSLRHPIWTDPPKDFTQIASELLEKEAILADGHWDPHNGRVPRALARVCDRGLSKQRGDRYQTMAELGADLQVWVEGREPVVCVTTFFIRACEWLRRQLDARPHQTTLLLVLGLGLGLVSVVLAVWAVVALIRGAL